MQIEIVIFCNTLLKVYIIYRLLVKKFLFKRFPKIFEVFQSEIQSIAYLIKLNYLHPNILLLDHDFASITLCFWNHHQV